jgi:hypothetical protein
MKGVMLLSGNHICLNLRPNIAIVKCVFLLVNLFYSEVGVQNRLNVNFIYTQKYFE